MSLFKIKNKKNVISDNRITLDAKHLKITAQFDNDSKNIEKYNHDLSVLKKELSIIKKSPLKKLNFEELEHKNMLEDKIKNLVTKINEIMNKEATYDYFIDTADILYKYYKDDIPQEKPADTNTKKFSTNVNNNKNTILDFFEKPATNDKSKCTVPRINKAHLLDEYLSKTEKQNYKSNMKYIKNFDYCKDCNIEKYLYHSEGILVCPKCGIIDHIVIDSDKPSYKDPPPEISYFAYKRINHFNEWLAQFQAKESTEIPNIVFDKILVEIKKERIDNMANLSNKKIREYLKKLKLNKYYEHVPHIINRLNGLPPPVMSSEVEEKLRIMFKEIQGPFLEVCPKERKNFLSYSYVLHKFVELLELDQYKSCFPLLKSREKLHQQDLIWKNICKKLNWHYIKSI